jgi:predicted  nucleic acid-binding Zn-ribbon protein
MKEALDILRRKLSEKSIEITSLLKTLNEMEKTISRLKNELTEEYKNIDNLLEG